jgi:uncharacterized membrane-anchored protein
MAFPTHPARAPLAGELHARPALPIAAPARLSRLAMLAPDAAAEEAHLAALCAQHGVAPPAPGATWFMADFGAFRLRFERHTEFTGWNVQADGANPDRPFAEPALGTLPPDWLAALPGQAIAAMHITLLGEPPGGLPEAPGEAAGFVPGSVAGAKVVEGQARVFTDFRLHGDGFNHLLLLGGATPLLTGRLAQTLWEIETYRALALLALPAARGVGPSMAAASERLSALAENLPRLDDLPAERAALAELAQVAGDIERANASTAERFSASAAYYRLVERRLAELDEGPLPGLPTLSRFLERRMDPAMATVAATGTRISALSLRAARLVDLLRARVALAQEAQAEKQLATLAATGRAQLRLQETVEGLSAAAIAYYVLSLLGYAIKPMPWGGLGTTAEVVLALAVPLVAAIVWLGIRRQRRTE